MNGDQYYTVSPRVLCLYQVIAVRISVKHTLAPKPYLDQGTLDSTKLCLWATPSEIFPMQEVPSLTIDYTQQASPLAILPEAPLVTSESRNWRGIHLHHYDHSEHETPLHSLAQHGLVITLRDAELEFKLGKTIQNKHLVAGNIQLIPAEVPYYAAWKQPLSFMVLAVEPFIFAAIAHEAKTHHAVQLMPQFIPSDPLIYGIGQVLKSELVCGNNNLLYIESLLNCLSTHLLHRYTASTKPSTNRNSEGLSSQQFGTLVDYIHQNLDQNLSLAELAILTRLSPSYLARLFRQTTGVTLHRYVMQCRIDRAKYLLKHSCQSLSEISLEVGFANQQHFTRQFRQFTGTTPARFRKTAL